MIEEIEAWNNVGEKLSDLTGSGRLSSLDADEMVRLLTPYWNGIWEKTVDREEKMAELMEPWRTNVQKEPECAMMEVLFMYVASIKADIMDEQEALVKHIQHITRIIHYVFEAGYHLGKTESFFNNMEAKQVD